MNLLNKHGCEFEAFITGNKVKGKIAVYNERAYLCQNEEAGAACIDTLGYKCSWLVGDGSEEALRINNVTGLIVIKKPILTSLPKEWCVKCDGSQLFAEKVLEYIHKHTSACYGGNEGEYYGMRINGSEFWSTSPNNTILTLEEFIELTEPKKVKKSKKKENENEQINNPGNIIEISRPLSKISAGKGCTGHTIYGKRGRAAIVIGHLSYREISVF